MPKVNENYFEGRRCCKCGENKVSWNWYKYKVKGIWDGKSYLCTNCGKKEYYKNVQKLDPYSHNNLIKSIANSRTGNLKKDSETGKSLIDQAIVAKIFHTEDLNIKLNNLECNIDIECDELGKIDVKGAKFYDDGWNFSNCKIDCDVFVCIGCNIDRKNISKVWIIYNDKYKTNIHVRLNSRKYKEFEVGSILYNNAYHSLLSYLKDKRYFGIEDIKKWMIL